MKTRPLKSKTLTAPSPAAAATRAADRHESAFGEVVQMIEAARARAYHAVNTELIDLYWRVGEHVSRKIANAGWGKNTVSELSAFIQARSPGIGGFSASNIWRMRQFHEVYTLQPKLAPLVRELNWTQNLLILARAKRPEEREFYLRVCLRERWGKRELERQLKGALFERTILTPAKLAPVVRQIHPAAETIFKDTYLLDFLDLPEVHSEADLQRALVANLKKFLLELGRDFSFVGEQYLLQVGGKDFRLDLLFYHRQLQCLVAIDLKIDEFQPEYLGKMEFYLEALDRDVRKPHERPSIGVLLCATKDRRVSDAANFLVIEIKRQASRHDAPDDLEQIRERWFKAPLFYRFGARLILDEEHHTADVCILTREEPEVANCLKLFHLAQPLTPPKFIRVRRGTLQRFVDRLVTSLPGNSALEQELDQQVYDLYGLTPEEIIIVEEAGQ